MKKELLKRMLPLLGLLALAAMILGLHPETPCVVINEVCSNNFAAGCDENGEYSDCIELYNPGKNTFSLDGCFLTDDDKEPEKYALDGMEVPAKGYTLIWLNKESPLRISKDGEKLFLIDSAKGSYLDQVIVPALSYDTSYGRIKDAKSKWSVMSASLGSSNQNARLLPAVSLDKPVFETTSGFYAEAFDLHLYSPAGEKIYYTLDGSEPDAGSLVYKNPIRIEDISRTDNLYAAQTDLAPTKDYTPDFPIDKAVVVRAVCYNPSANRISETVTETFFVGYDAKSEYTGMPVISLTADPEDLFDVQTGIYANGAKYEEYLSDGGMKDGQILDEYTDENGEIHYRYMASNAFNRGKEWERKATLSYFDENHSHLFTQNMGIRIAGNSTRSSAQKSFNVFARDIYDDSETVPYDFFGTDIDCSTIKLRNGGGNGDGVKFLDAFLETAVSGRSVSTQGTSPCVVFLNGEYWGIYNVRERYNAEYPALHYGLDPDSIMLVKSGNAVTSSAETMEAYKYMQDVITQCDLVYDDTYALACDLVDIQSLIDYCCINLYLDNRDVGLGYNTALWRTTQEDTPYGDGRWRYMLFDLDECIFPDSNITEGRENWMAQHPLLTDPVVLSLLDNESFRRQFCITFMDLANTVFSYERIHPMLTRWSDFYETQIIKDHHRFYDASYHTESYRNDVGQIDSFFQERASFALESLARTFQLQGTLNRISISTNNPEGGRITVNTAELEDCSAWEGYYYSDFPVTLYATPNDGWHFTGWSRSDGSSTSGTELSVSLAEGDVSLQAVFEKDDS